MGVFDKEVYESNYFIPHKLFLILYLFWLLLYVRRSWKLRVIDFFILPIFMANWIFGAMVFGNTEVIGLLIEPGIISLLLLTYYSLMSFMKGRGVGYFNSGIVLIFLLIIYHIADRFLWLYRAFFEN